jgi:hypothetical protein
MRESVRNRLNIFMAVAATVGGMLVSAPIILAAGPAMESHVFPVVTGVQLAGAGRSGSSVLFEVVGVKARPCTYLGASALSGPRDGFMQSARLSFPGALGDSITRPPGAQAFGFWLIEPTATDEKVVIQVRHHCHGLWDTTTQLGPWTVPAQSVDYSLRPLK